MVFVAFMSTRPFTVGQPKDGDLVLHCGHLGQSYPGERWHWFEYDPPTKFKRPDGTKGEASWLVACNACFERHGEKVPVRGDGRWKGDEPVIRERRQI